MKMRKQSRRKRSRQTGTRVQLLLGTVCSFLLSSLRTFCPPAAGWTQQRHQWRHGTHLDWNQSNMLDLHPVRGNVLRAAAVCPTHLVLCCLSAQQVEVEPGVESVLLPWRTTENLDGDVKVEWKDKDDRTVYVYQNGSDQPGEQDKFYRTRTKMDENLLKTGDLSLTLNRPTERDTGTYTGSVYRDGDMLRMGRVRLNVIVLQVVEVESGVESVLLPCRTRKNLDGDVKVEWMDEDNRTVHVYQNGSDQPGEQNQIYRTRTKMDENLLKNKDLSLTLRRPRDEDRGIYTCIVSNRDGDMLMVGRIWLNVKGTDRVQPEDTRTGSNSIDQPLLGDQLV